MIRVTGITVMTRKPIMTGMTGMTRVTEMTGMTRGDTNDLVD